MKILFLNTDICYGGATKMLVWVADCCAKIGHHVTFITYRDSNRRYAIADGINYIHLNTGDGVGGKGLWRTVYRIHRLIKRERYDLGIAFLSPSQLRLAISSIGTDIKLLFSERGDPTRLVRKRGIKGYIMYLLGLWVNNKAQGYVFQTQMAKACFSEKRQSHSRVIPNPVLELIRTRSRSEGVEKRIVNVARLDIKQKRQDLLIKAFKIISDSHPEYELQLYGDSSLELENDEKVLRDLASDCSQIKFMGQTNNVVEAIQNAAMVVLSSDSEGIPNILLEAMSIGVPCISTDCTPGGAAMLINSGENGLLVPRNDVVKLAEAIEFFIDNPGEAERMGQNGLYVNREFSQDKIAQKWLDYVVSFTNN